MQKDVAYGRVVDICQCVGEESLHEQKARGLRIDAAGGKIEKVIGVNLAGGGAVCAFHIVGINLKLGFAIDLRPTRKEQRLMQLLTVRLLGVPSDKHPPLINAARFTIDNALEDLA